MRYVTIEPVATKPEKIDAKVWDAIKKRGAFQCNYITAIQNIKNAREAYRIKPDTVKIEAAGSPFDVDNMSAEQLTAIVMSSGKRIKKQAMKMSDLRKLARRVLAETITIDDDTEVEIEIDDGEGSEDEATSNDGHANDQTSTVTGQSAGG